MPAQATGKKVAVIGAGPAGLSCAGELAKLGHRVTLFERRELAGGLSTYGIIGLREPVEMALAEVAMVREARREVGNRQRAWHQFDAAELQREFGAVFLSVGLGATPSLGIPGEEHILDGLEYIEQSKMDVSRLVVGQNVVVIGAGNTAIDCATIARRLGRRARDHGLSADGNGDDRLPARVRFHQAGRGELCFSDTAGAGTRGKRGREGVGLRAHEAGERRMLRDGLRHSRLPGSEFVIVSRSDCQGDWAREAFAGRAAEARKRKRDSSRSTQISKRACQVCTQAAIAFAREERLPR